MIREYVHQELNKELNVPSGYYVLFKELKIKCDGREILCVTGVGVLECSACAGFSIAAGRGGEYALVPGYIVRWKAEKNEEGLWISDVEPIEDERIKREIAAVIRGTENIRNIEFWLRS
jgi:hypothetical protein